jgi:L-threonylcarbamoyladenylate synthase
VPLAAPSANPFGAVSPTTAQHVRDSLRDQVDMILDGGPCRTGVESTVVSLVGEPVLLRPGGTPVEDIEGVIGKLERGAGSPALESAGFMSPGMMTSHYAPRTPVQLVSRAAPVTSDPATERVGRLCFTRPTESLDRIAALEVLSETGDLREAAANLFAAIRRLDAAGLDRIVADEFPERGLGLAIRDRLARAAGSPPKSG